MKKIIFGIFLSIFVITCSVLIRIITITEGDNDCMLQYVMSKEQSGYMYMLKENMYHIDTVEHKEFKQIGISRGCLMVPYNPEFSFVALSNTFYCGVASILSL